MVWVSEHSCNFIILATSDYYFWACYILLPLISYFYLNLCSFYLYPCEGSNVQIHTQGKLSAPRILKIQKVSFNISYWQMGNNSFMCFSSLLKFSSFLYEKKMFCSKRTMGRTFILEAINCFWHKIEDITINLMINLFYLYETGYWVELNSAVQIRAVRQGLSKPHKDLAISLVGVIFRYTSSHPGLSCLGLDIWKMEEKYRLPDNIQCC